jgi:hypothetical protein
VSGFHQRSCGLSCMDIKELCRFGRSSVSYRCLTTELTSISFSLAAKISSLFSFNTSLIERNASLRFSGSTS